MSTVAIVQSSYIPWKGYFDLINSADEFMLFDDVQFTRRDWRNRNRVKTAGGLVWLTIPVKAKGRYEQRIDEVCVEDQRWRARHWRTLNQSYAKAACFPDYAEQFEALYLGAEEELLSAVNARFIEAICGELGITTRITRTSDHGIEGGEASERLAALTAAVGGTEYLSGPSGRDYLRTEPFAERGLEIRYAAYEGYPEYRQLHGGFEHQVSVLDLLFNEGPDARRYMGSFR
ncbi:MAG: WbqC family protein [Thermoleophilaceae bacterium]|nr:WbqC family protein [Thermoleophilaceae bacterium]